MVEQDVGVLKLNTCYVLNALWLYDAATWFGSEAINVTWLHDAEMWSRGLNLTQFHLNSCLRNDVLLVVDGLRMDIVKGIPNAVRGILAIGRVMAT